MYVICIRVVSPLDYLRVNCRRLVSLSLNTQLCFTKDKKKKKKQSQYGQHKKKDSFENVEWPLGRPAPRPGRPVLWGLPAPRCLCLSVCPSLPLSPSPRFPPACRRQVSPAHGFGFMYSFFLEETLESHLSPVTVLMST